MGKSMAAAAQMAIMSHTEMTRRLQGSGLESFICQPGMTSTPVYAKTDKSQVLANVLDAAQKVFGQTEERGAIPLLHSATAPELTGDACTCLLSLQGVLWHSVGPCMCKAQLIVQRHMHDGPLHVQGSVNWAKVLDMVWIWLWEAQPNCFVEMHKGAVHLRQRCECNCRQGWYLCGTQICWTLHYQPVQCGITGSSEQMD